ncbi:matrix protein [Harrison Dam virus]|uniref:Matrix protein n=1 Tax=Harrison Dam virus TaxID=1569259 RepID=A0A0A0V2B4_9RHAB|nr:matrix protein [Harrison Dam virus]AIW61122.1 matrix protein [Harrison Dam virus]
MDTITKFFQKTDEPLFSANPCNLDTQNHFSIRYLKINFKIKFELLQEGATDLRKIDLEKAAAKSYRGPSEYEGIFLIALALSCGSWVRSKCGKKNGFVGEFRVKAKIFNPKLLQPFDHEKFHCFSIKDWVIRCEYELTSEETKSGGAMNKRIQQKMKQWRMSPYHCIEEQDGDIVIIH